MKRSKIKGYINDLENKNKNFSFDKSIKILDISNAVYIDIIEKYDFKSITNYKNSKYLFKEISNELNEITELLNNNKTLMAVCLLRNVYEEIMYIIATSYCDNLDIDFMTKAGYFKDIVADNCNELLGDIYTSDEIKGIYSYLSIITHVTNIKEAVSYLSGNKRIKGYIVNEIKYVSLIIENLYITFLNKKSKLDNSMCDNIISVAGYVELINTMYYVANSTGETKRIESYFYGEKNKKYLEKQKELIISDFKELQSNKDELSRSIRIISKELDKQLAENNYTEMVNQILNS
jgi:hypothetical protein